MSHAGSDEIGPDDGTTGRVLAALETAPRAAADPSTTVDLPSRPGDDRTVGVASEGVSGTDAARRVTPPGPGRTIGRYVVVRTLGRGAFGEVYLAHDPQLDRQVAIKVPRADRLGSESQVEQYLAEARVLARLDDPGIVRVFDAGRTEDGGCYCVSQYIEGTDLAGLTRRGRPSSAEAAAIVARSAEALHHAHERGLVHRDVKPANLLIDAEGAPHVADFGLALLEQDFGKGSGFAGTPAYMSPEQARGEGHRVDRRSDVYSLGAVFYELLTGERAARGADLRDLLDRIGREDPAPPRSIDPTVPAELERICLKAMARRAGDRYATARAMADDLRHWERSRVGSVLFEGEGEGEGGGEARIVPPGLRPFGGDDAETYPDLIPGPRGRDGLPDALRFWKERVEEIDDDATFRVGLLLGPSGCGKSSLVRAGVVPRLAAHVSPIYVEATFDETEAALLRAIRKRYPGLDGADDLAGAVASLRRGQGPPPGRKVILIVDQFEQWLFARAGERASPLVEALRQCDGGRVQCLLLARDDYALAATAFMDEIEVPIVQGENFAALGLFDVAHARAVLSRFGRALGRLHADAGRLTEAQGRFLDRAVAGLAQGERVVPVRLALFAEMAKDRPWTSATLDAIGGAEGIGVAFLDEQLGTAAANPRHRALSGPARALLGALLPRTATDLKGHRRSRAELAQAAGLQVDASPFADLLRILDGELRLLTPSRPEAAEGAVADASTYSLAPAEWTPGAPSGRADDRYQLAHDHWVPILREWLGKLKRETPEGQAEIVLAERASLWAARPEVRLLPSWREWLAIRRRTRPHDWTDRQRRMMRAADRLHLANATVGAVLLALAASGAWGFVRLGRERRELSELRERTVLRSRETSLRVYAALLADAQEAAEGANPGRAGRLLDAIEPELRGWEWRHVDWVARGRTPRERSGRDSTAAPDPKEVMALLRGPDGVTLTASRKGGGVLIRADADDPRDKAALEVDSGRPLSAVVFAPDGARLALVRPAAGPSGPGGANWEISVWDLPARDSPWRTGATSEHPGGAIAFGGDGRFAVVRPRREVLDASSGRSVRRFGDHADPDFNPSGALACSFRFSEQRFAYGHAAQLVAVDAFSGTEVGSIAGYAENDLPRLVAAPDAPRVLEVGRPGGSLNVNSTAIPGVRVIPRALEHVGDLKIPLTVWDVGRGTALWADRRPYPERPSVVFGPGSARLALWGEGTTVRVLSVDTGAPVAEIEGQPAGPHAVAFHPDGRRLAIAEAGGRIRIWDLDRDRPVSELGGSSLAVAFHPDGSRLASTAKGRFATLWDVGTGTRLCTLPGAGGESVDFGRAGLWLSSGEEARYAPPAARPR